MIRYFASDMIKRAEQLADIENSDFISFGEKIALLNEAYQKVYQAGVNKDNNAFVRYINTKSKVIPLPPDFHQIKAITLTHCGEITTILRRPANQSLNLLSYDIINNVLQINGETSGDTICIEYFPTPVSLTFPNKNLDLEISDEVADMHKSILVSRVDGDLVIRDLNDSSFTAVISHEDYPNITQYLMHIEDDFISFCNGTSTNLLYNLNKGEMTSYSLPIVIYRNKTYLYDDVAKKLLLPVHNRINGTIEFADLDIDLHGCQIAILSDDMTQFVGQNYNTGVYINDTLNDFDADKMFYWKDKVFLTNRTELLQVYDFQIRDKKTTQLESAAIAISGINDNTGYGYLGFRLGKYSLVSFFDDTELNFPKNIYFTYMAYLLALAFKSKQGSDTTQLAALTLDAENQFYDTLGRDDWGCTRITNVY